MELWKRGIKLKLFIDRKSIKLKNYEIRRILRKFYLFLNNVLINKLQILNIF